MEIPEFDGIFRFTNPTDEDFKFLWNNKEYLFPAQTCCPMLIANETLENIQEIRKKAAYKLSMREFFKGKEYTKLVKQGGLYPSTFDEKFLEPMIEQCLAPLPMSKAIVTEAKRENRKMIASAAIDSHKSLRTMAMEDETLDGIE